MNAPCLRISVDDAAKQNSVNKSFQKRFRLFSLSLPYFSPPFHAPLAGLYFSKNPVLWWHKFKEQKIMDSEEKSLSCDPQIDTAARVVALDQIMARNCAQAGFRLEPHSMGGDDSSQIQTAHAQFEIKNAQFEKLA